MEKQKALLMYQKISKRLDTVEATIAQMTLHEIYQRSDYLESQLEEMDDFDVQSIIVKHLYNDPKIKRNHKNMLERIRIF